MIEQKKKKINGVTYAVTQMGGFKALETQTKLIKIIGPFLSSGGLETIEAKLPEILRHLDTNFISDFAISVFDDKVLRLDNKGLPNIIDFDQDFAGVKINDMWELLIFIIEVNELLKGKFIKEHLLTAEAEVEA